MTVTVMVSLTNIIIFFTIVRRCTSSQYIISKYLVISVPLRDPFKKIKQFKLEDHFWFYYVFYIQRCTLESYVSVLSMYVSVRFKQDGIVANISLGERKYLCTAAGYLLYVLLRLRGFIVKRINNKSTGQKSEMNYY